MQSNNFRTGNIIAIAVFIFAFCFFSCGCAREKASKTSEGTPIGSSDSKIIGASGGDLTSSDGRLTVSVPPGAVASDTTFSIQPITILLPTSIGGGYRLGPSGTNFSQPISLTFSIPEAGVSRTSLGGIGIAYQSDDGYWHWITDASRDAAKHSITVQTSHFTDFANVEGIVLSPGHASLKTGERLTVQAKLCASKDMDGPLAPLVCDCQPLNGVDTTLENWSVNGTPGGNGTFGTVSGSLNSATFTAPAQAPDPKTVRVSVEAQATQWSWMGGASTEKSLAFSYITIGPDSYKGDFTVSVEAGMSVVAWTGKGEATWTLSDPEVANGDFNVAGTITSDQTQFDFGDAVCTLNSATRSFTGTGQTKDNPLEQYWTIGTTTWSATCTGSGGSYQVDPFLSIVWCAGCPSLDQWYPLADINELKGSFFWSGCSPISVPVPIPGATVTWDFPKE